MVLRCSDVKQKFTLRDIANTGFDTYAIALAKIGDTVKTAQQAESSIEFFRGVFRGGISGVKLYDSWNDVFGKARLFSTFLSEEEVGTVGRNMGSVPWTRELLSLSNMRASQI